MTSQGKCIDAHGDDDRGDALDHTLRFVVHEHYATTHHYDLRLECGGTLWSWALPKGPPTDPSRNRLAVRVGDHDLDHLEFVDPAPVAAVPGAIAKSIWDAGTYRTVRSNADKLVVDIAGSRLNGRYALFRTDGSNWIMHLMTTGPDHEKDSP